MLALVGAMVPLCLKICGAQGRKCTSQIVQTMGWIYKDIATGA